MTPKDVAIMKAVAVVVREYVSQAWSDVAARVKALEAYPAPRDGAPGPAGEKGQDGAIGQPGEPGAVGPAGERGEKGEQGERGEHGHAGADGKSLQGERGPEGEPGRDGRDGLPGVPGQPGEKGLGGAAGAPGVDGKDGRDGTLENIKIVQIDDRTISFCFKNGDPIEGGVLWFPIEIYRGVYIDGKQYEVGDTATWAGSTWHCNEPTKTKPGDGSKAWTLKVKRGRDGRDGNDAPGALPVVKVGGSR